jgi:hypothetical protein
MITLNIKKKGYLIKWLLKLLFLIDSQKAVLMFHIFIQQNEIMNLTELAEA